ncbi:MAG: class I SAM-dependent methyltransferase [Hyphomicrobiaceae bacterium]
MMKITSLARLCLFSAAVALSLTPAVAEREPNWKVFDEVFDRTPEPTVDAMLKLADVNANDLVYDLGCGDGVIVVTAAKKYGAKGLGIDINPKMIARAKANAEKNNVADKTTFLEGDLYKTDLKPATVITLFLWPTMNLRLRPRLLDLAPGTRIVSYEHHMGAWAPDRTVYVPDPKWGRLPLFLWVIPAKIAGSWQVRVDGGELSVKLEQTYQRFHGTDLADGRTRRIRNGGVDGAKVKFDLTAADGKTKHYTGIITSSGAIEGSGWYAMRKM